MSIKEARILRITSQNIRPDSENSFKGSRHTKGVAEDPKGLKPTDCDCWAGGRISACPCESKSVDEPE